jgi:hypothetical protein
MCDEAPAKRLRLGLLIPATIKRFEACRAVASGGNG